MRVLNLKNLKNCRNVGTTLFGNYGLKAIKIPSGKTVFRIQKRIKSFIVTGNIIKSINFNYLK